MTLKRSLIWLAVLAILAACAYDITSCVGERKETQRNAKEAVRREHAEARCTNSIVLPERIVVEGQNYTCDADGYAVEERAFR